MSPLMLLGRPWSMGGRPILRSARLSLVGVLVKNHFMQPHHLDQAFSSTNSAFSKRMRGTTINVLKHDFGEFIVRYVRDIFGRNMRMCRVMKHLNSYYVLRRVRILKL